MIKQKKVTLPERGAAAVILSWFTSPGKDVYEGLPICVFHYVGSSEQLTFKAPCEGVVESLHPLGAEVEAGQPIMVLSVCTHDVQFHQMCGICGKDLTLQHFSRTTPNTTNLTLIHSQPEIKVSRQEAERDAQSTAKRLLAHKRLSLILDLDQTLVHATNDMRVEPLYAEKEKKQAVGSKDTSSDEPKEEGLGDPTEGLHRFQLEGPVKSNNVFFVKERPHLREFLEEAHKMFELHIYTMGTRKYAEEVARIMDPNHTLFRENIVSRDDTTSIDFKSIQRIFPCDDSMVIIVDDRVDVWGTCKNVVRIEPFLFFHDTKVNALPRDAQRRPIPHKKPEPDEENDKKRKREEGEEAATQGPGNTDAKGEKERSEGSGDAEPSTKKQKVETSESAGSTEVTTAPLQSTPAPAVTPALPQTPQQSPPFTPYIPAAMKDTQLLHILRLLKEVHSMFYTEEDKEKEKETEGEKEKEEKEKEKEKEPEKEQDRDKGKEKVNQTDKFEPETVVLGGSGGKRRRRTKEEEDEDEMFWNEEKGTHLVKDVKYYLYLARKHVLKGAHILFSGLFPLNTVPEQTYLWMVAEAFGAICHSSAASMGQVTHLVASKGGTEKVREASAFPNIKIVHVRWLLDSLRNYKKADESAYSLSATPTPTHPKGGEGGLSERDLHFMKMLHVSYVEGLRELVDRCEKKKMREYRALRRSSSGLGASEGADMDKFLESVLGKSADGEDEDDEDEDEDEEDSEEGDTDYGTSDSESSKDSDNDSKQSPSASDDGSGDGEDADFDKMLEEELGDF